VLRIPTAVPARYAAVRTIVNQNNQEVALECGLRWRVESALGHPARRRLSLQLAAGSRGAPLSLSLAARNPLLAGRHIH
jgi:hypothetical protein